MFAELPTVLGDRAPSTGSGGNDKGKVEGLAGYARRNIMTRLPVAESFDALNARFLNACAKRRQARLRGHAATIAERMQAGHVAGTTITRCRRPTAIMVLAKGYVDRVEITCRGETIAMHARSYDTADFVYNPSHYLALLARRSIRQRPWTIGSSPNASIVCGG